MAHVPGFVRTMCLPKSVRYQRSLDIHLLLCFCACVSMLCVYLYLSSSLFLSLGCCLLWGRHQAVMVMTE